MKERGRGRPCCQTLHVLYGGEGPGLVKWNLHACRGGRTDTGPVCVCF